MAGRKRKFSETSTALSAYRDQHFKVIFILFPSLVWLINYRQKFDIPY